MQFYKKNTIDVIPLMCCAIIFLDVMYFYIIIQNIRDRIIWTFIPVLVTVLLPVLGARTNREGIYVDESTIIWKRLFRKKITSIDNISAIIILYNVINKPILGTTVPAYETKKSKKGIEYVYSMVLVNDASAITQKYESNWLFIREYKENVIGCALYDEDFVNYILEKKGDIKILDYVR